MDKRYEWADIEAIALRDPIVAAACTMHRNVKGFTREQALFTMVVLMAEAKKAAELMAFDALVNQKQVILPVVPEGFVLVPVIPTREMWAAVYKLDDEMAAGCYDGKGCTIEQAWDCLLANAPLATIKPRG